VSDSGWEVRADALRFQGQAAGRHREVGPYCQPNVVATAMPGQYEPHGTVTMTVVQPHGTVTAAMSSTIW
jgi:hypothetical protein